MQLRNIKFFEHVRILKIPKSRKLVLRKALL